MSNVGDHYKGVDIFSDIEREGFDTSVRVWRGYRLVRDEFNQPIHEYIEGTAALSLSECKLQIDDAISAGL